jgi:hypothetical protein
LFRDAAQFKAAYAFGLQRNETRMFDASDFVATSLGRSSASMGCAGSGSAKAKKGSPPKQRSV